MLINEKRNKAIERYVTHHNEQQRGDAYKQSMQARIMRIKKDLVTMSAIKEHITSLFEIYEHLDETSTALASVIPFLSDTHIKHEVTQLGESRATITAPITQLLRDKERCTNERHLIDVAMHHLRYAYEENSKALIKLRKCASEELVRMYMAFRLLRPFIQKTNASEREARLQVSCSFEQSHCVYVMRFGGRCREEEQHQLSDMALMGLIFEHYRRIIFSGVVLLDKKILENAFMTIERL